MAQSDSPYPVQLTIDYTEEARDRLTVFRQKYPRWWFDWNLALSRFTNRVAAYIFVMRDEYPSTDEEQSVHLEFSYPDAERDLNRWLPIVK